MIKELENAIGYRFHNINLLQNALAHSSYANERWHNSLMSNERLEFLGDSILGMVVADHLYRNFPNRPEGELTRMRADMVCEKALAQIAGRIGLGSHLLLGKGEEKSGFDPCRCCGVCHRCLLLGWRHGSSGQLYQAVCAGERAGVPSQ